MSSCYIELHGTSELATRNKSLMLEETCDTEKMNERRTTPSQDQSDAGIPVK